MQDKILDNDLVTTEELDNMIDEKSLELVVKSINQDNNDEVKDLTHLFNQNILKKNMLRVLKYNGLLDMLGDEALERIKNNPESISDKELAGYMRTIQGIIDSASKNISTIPETLPIQPVTNNITINTGESGLNRDSREKVLNVVEAILKMTNSQNEGNN